MEEFFNEHKSKFGENCPFFATDTDLSEWNDYMSENDMALLKKNFARIIDDIWKYNTIADLEKLYNLHLFWDIPMFEKYLPRNPDLISNAVICKSIKQIYNKYINQHSSVPDIILQNALDTAKLIMTDIWKTRIIEKNSDLKIKYNVAATLLGLGNNGELLSFEINPLENKKSDVPLKKFYDLDREFYRLLAANMGVPNLGYTAQTFVGFTENVGMSSTSYHDMVANQMWDDEFVLY